MLFFQFTGSAFSLIFCCIESTFIANFLLLVCKLSFAIDSIVHHAQSSQKNESITKYSGKNNLIINAPVNNVKHKKELFSIDSKKLAIERDKQLKIRIDKFFYHSSFMVITVGERNDVDFMGVAGACPICSSRR